MIMITTLEAVIIIVWELLLKPYGKILNSSDDNYDEDYDNNDDDKHLNLFEDGIMIIISIKNIMIPITITNISL